MINYDFIEIGLSDFDTIIQQDCSGKTGASIEPIKYYLNRLPEKNNIKKINWAISNYNGKIPIYYINEENILDYKLPEWVRGCNSVNNFHPTVLNLLKQNNISVEIFSIETVEVHDIEYLFDYLSLEKLEFLKIDCEGHDTIIVNNLLDYCKKNISKLPKFIQFENNALSDIKAISEITARLQSFNYKKHSTGLQNELEFYL